ncbi:hypothetical protein N9S59_01465 [Pseudomonadota bacterium]|nr:hypothetical protein [Pseudomonadota bacterium]
MIKLFASMVRLELNPERSPILTIRSLIIPMSPLYDSSPEPSTIVPLIITMSKSIFEQEAKIKPKKRIEKTYS